MSDWGILFLLYAVGAGLLLAEIFIPSHGILTVAGLGFIVVAVVKTFTYGGRAAGITAVLACLVLLPTFAVLSIRYWPRTPIGKRIAPPNPVLTSADTSVPISELSALVGRTGQAVSPLRPVGICEFDGRRVSCVTEFGVVSAGTTVQGTGIRSGNLVVRVATA